MRVKYIGSLLAVGITAALLLPAAHGQTCSGGLGERSFTIARPPSSFGVSVLAGADIAVDPWPEGPLRICAGPDQANGVHPLSLMEDVVIGFSVIDTSVTCFKIFAAGSGGSIDCDGGSAHDVFSTQNSNHGGVEDPPVVITGLGGDGGPGGATLTATMSTVALPVGSDPGECSTQDYSNTFPVAFTTATATSEVTDALPDHGTRSLAAVGSNFNCFVWTLTDSAGALVAPVSGFDTVVGDVAAALKLVDTPLPTGPGAACGDNEVNQDSEQCDGTDDDLCPGECGAPVPWVASACLCPPDHYLCYKTRQLGGRFTERQVSLEDDFGQAVTTVKKPQHFCNPVDKDGEGIDDPTAHLMCYRIKDERLRRRDVVVENQFGQQTLTVTRPDTLCAPAEKDAVPSALSINDFKCYKVRRAKGTPKFSPREVTLEDQFETREMRVVRPRYLCNPTDKEGEGIVNPQGHLLCYRVKDVPGEPRFQSREVDMVDQFAQQDLKILRADCRASSLLCVPSNASPAGEVEFVEVEGDRFIRDDRGRALILHGLNVENRAKSDPLRVGRSTREFVLQMARGWGFNVARHLIFWDAIEPQSGVFDEQYLDRVEERLDWYAEAGIFVILDMHQDVYSRFFCCDGAPEWAIRSDGLPFEAQSVWWQNYFQPAVQRAFDNFWAYTDGAHADLQDEYAAAWLHVIERFRDHPAVLGYDLMNEPHEGSAENFEFERTLLAEFYNRLIERIRVVDPDGWIFVEPTGFVVNPGGPSELPRLQDPRPGRQRLAYFPHLYDPGVFTGGGYQGPSAINSWAANRRAEIEQRHRAPLLIGELGEGPPEYYRDLFAMTDEVTSGWMRWVSDVYFDAFQDGREADDLDDIVRVYPQRIGGDPIGHAYDPDTRVLTIRFAERAGVRGPTEIYIPASRVYPGGWTVEVTDPEGAWSSDWDPEREILSVFTDAGQAEHVIRIQPQP